MSAFGAAGYIRAVMVIAVLLVLVYGWEALVVALLLGAGFTTLVVRANRQYYPDGTPRAGGKSQARK